jgi:dipeptidyl aminopeptidase/acylaminoacyl peptidase
MTIRASGEDAAEITVHDDLASITFFRQNQNGKYVPVTEDVCSGSPATMSGTGIYTTPNLVIASPVLTCDDGSEPKGVGDLPPLEDELRHLTFEHDPESDILTDSSSGGSGLAVVWGRADAENRIGDVSGWITSGNKRGIWALDLTSPGDPADRVRLSSTPGTPAAWSPDGSKLLVLRDVKGSDSGDWGETDLLVLNPDGSETHLTRANGLVTAGSFSPDGSKVVYAVQGDRSTISVVDASGGPPDILRTREWRSSRVCCLYGATFSPDGTQIAYFEGMYDHSNTLQIMNADGSGSRTLIQQEFGHVRGLQWSPDGSRLAFASGGLWVVGADGTGLTQISSEQPDRVDPHWSPDGSHIAYTRYEDERGSLEIVRLEDLKVQNFGVGESGPWLAELQW